MASVSTDRLGLKVFNVVRRLRCCSRLKYRPADRRGTCAISAILQLGQYARFLDNLTARLPVLLQQLALLGHRCAPARYIC